MSESRRVQKVEKELRQVIASYLLGGFKGPLAGLVSVTRVIAAKDLRQAKVYVSVMGSEQDREVSLEGLENYAGDIQREVNRRLSMKFCPKLKFFIDESADKVMKIDAILHDIDTQKSSTPDSEE